MLTCAQIFDTSFIDQEPDFEIRHWLNYQVPKIRCLTRFARIEPLRLKMTTRIEFSGEQSVPGTERGSSTAIPIAIAVTVDREGKLTCDGFARGTVKRSNRLRKARKDAKPRLGRRGGSLK